MNRTTPSSSPLNNPYLLGGIAGIAFVILLIVSIVLQGDPPSFDDDIKDIRQFFTDDANQYLVGDWLTGVAIIFLFTPFLVFMRSVLVGADPAGLWANIALAGGLIFLVLAGASGMAFGGAALAEAKDMDESTLRLVVAMNSYGFSIATLGLSLMVGATSVVVARTGVLWRWLALVGGIAAVLGLVGALAPLQHDGESFIGLVSMVGQLFAVVFVLLSSVCMLMRRNRTPAAAGA